MARVAPTTRPKNRKRRAIVVFCRLCGFWAILWFFGELVVFCRLCGFLPSLWFFGELVVFGRACGSLFQSRDKWQIAKGFDDRVEVVLVTRIGGGYGYDQVLMFQEYPIKKGK